MQRYFIEDQDLLKSILPQLQLVNQADMPKLFIDIKTSQHWVKYDFELAGKDAVGIRVWPYPSLDKIIHIALSTIFPDEADGAMALLHDLEWSQRLEFREKLIDAVEKEIESVSFDRFDTIYHRAELWTKDNRREIFGKHIAQIQIDADYFNMLSLRAAILYNRIQQRDNNS